MCDTTVTFSITPVAGVTTYLWSVPAGSTIIGSPSGISCTVYFSPSFITNSISVVALNSCNQPRPVRTYAVRNVAQAPLIIFGPITVCANQTNIFYSTPAVPGVTSILWSVPSSAQILSGQGTLSIKVKWGTRNGNVNAQAFRSCSGYSSTKSQLVTVTCRQSMDEFSSEINLNIIPNPSNGNFNLSLDLEKSMNVSIEIMDLSGRLIQSDSRTLETGNSIIPYSLQVENGMYLFRVTSDDKVFTKAFVINN